MLNKTGKSILGASKTIKAWEIDGEKMESFYSMIINDTSIVKSVLLLTGTILFLRYQFILSKGSIDALKRQVFQYITRFDRYTFLWKQNLQEAYRAFMETHPTLEDFEAELQKYMGIQNEVDQLQSRHNLGPLCLETEPLKHSLRSEAASWKARFSKNLHEKGEEDLKNLDQYIRDMTVKLNRKVVHSKTARFERFRSDR